MDDSGAQHSRFAAIFAGGTLVSRVLGLVRDLTWTALIPAASFDAFIVAFRLPNMLRELVGEGASNAAFVPVLSETLETGSEDDFRDLVSATMSAMLVLLAGLTTAGILLIPKLIGALQYMDTFTRREAVSPERIETITTLAMWTFPYLMFIGMAIFCMAPLYTIRHYFTPAWGPALLNVALIATCVFLRDSFEEPAYALVTGVWLGGIAQLLAQYIALGRKVGVWWPNFKLRHPGIRTMFVLLIPVLLGQAAGEMNRLIDILFAASLPEEGTVRALFLANRLVQLPLSIFGAATAVALLPTLSRFGARDEYDKIREALMGGLRRCFFLITPAMVGLMVMGTPLVRLLFERGQFGPADTEKTATVLTIYAAGLLSFAWVKVSVTGYFAVKDTRTPVLIASASMLLNILLNFALIGPLGYLGLALATTISFTMNAGFLYLFLSQKFGALYDAAFGAALLRMTIASLLMAVVTYVVYINLLKLVPGESFGAQTVQALVPVGAAALSYAGFCSALGVQELSDFVAGLQRKR